MVRMLEASLIICSTAIIHQSRGWPTLAHVARVGFEYAGFGDSYAAGRFLSSDSGDEPTLNPLNPPKD